MSQSLIEKIDALLPQTQCGQCSYAGCLPYAQAIVKQNEAINRCLPGGVKTLQSLAQLLDCNAAPLLDDMQQKQQLAQIAVIREEECIGCTKCIQACPVDAILGAAKQLHTVMHSECTGCGLCVEPCPVDCIDLQTIAKNTYQPDRARQRYYARQQRLAEKSKNKFSSSIPAIAVPSTAEDSQPFSGAEKSYVQAALERVRAKRSKASS